MITCNCC